jgi:hypothetical protein
VDAKTGNETKVEIIEIVPYSRFAALSRLGKVLGYDVSDKSPAKFQITQHNNTQLIGQINQIRDAIKNGEVPKELTVADGVDEAFIKKMVEAPIIKTVDRVDDGSSTGED